MSATSPAVTQIDRRAIEAEILRHVHETLRDHYNEATALAIVTEAAGRAAAEAGAAFAAIAPEGPSLAHFATVLERWKAGGAIVIEDLSLGGRELSFTVTDCAYIRLYREMGLPPELAQALSCSRDAPFARAYHPGLSLERPQAIGEGADTCLFRFLWDDDVERKKKK